jgi:hypothetical protein
LCQGEHPIEAALRAEKSARNLKASIDREFVRVRFTETHGGTELGFRLNPQESDWSNANFDAPAGMVKLVGDVVLDYVSVRCIAEIDITTLKGRGHLVQME